VLRRCLAELGEESLESLRFLLGLRRGQSIARQKYPLRLPVVLILGMGVGRGLSAPIIVDSSAESGGPENGVLRAKALRKRSEAVISRLKDIPGLSSSEKDAGRRTSEGYRSIRNRLTATFSVSWLGSSGGTEASKRGF
jgi:hypothetical protein